MHALTLLLSLVSLVSLFIPVVTHKVYTHIEFGVLCFFEENHKSYATEQFLFGLEAAFSRSLRESNPDDLFPMLNISLSVFDMKYPNNYNRTLKEKRVVAFFDLCDSFSDFASSIPVIGEKDYMNETTFLRLNNRVFKSPTFSRNFLILFHISNLLQTLYCFLSLFLFKQPPFPENSL